MDASGFSRTPGRASSSVHSMGGASVSGMARHTLGLLLLLCVVFLWTACNFLGSSIFANDSYAKPFFLTYLNTSSFMLAMVPGAVQSGYRRYRKGQLYATLRRNLSIRRLAGGSGKPMAEAEAFLGADDAAGSPDSAASFRSRPKVHLGLRPTARLSLAFCILWFSANYFAMACLQYTTVASTTILTATSSVWTLLIGSITGTERFTWRKLMGVLASLIGIILISHVDLRSGSAPSDSTPRQIGVMESFPDKTSGELLLGDALALVSAVIYGFYTIKLKHTAQSAAPLELDMPLFFGLTGFFNAVLLWPLFPLLSVTKLEPFQLPPTSRIWTILIVNSASSLLSDMCWAYALVLTSPLVVTIGLSLTIPLSLVGEMIIQGRTEGALYWVGAAIVVISFVFVDREEVNEEQEAEVGLFDGGTVPPLDLSETPASELAPAAGGASERGRGGT